MFNAYAIIIGLFILGGLVTVAWGARLIARARVVRRWPRAEGVIETADPTRPDDDLLPHIVFSYRVDGKMYRHAVELPAGALPTPELTAAWLRDYPIGRRVTVFYDPRRPDNALLEPGRVGAGDWLVVALGAGAALIGLLMLLM